jgi:hypothetical protein
LLFDELRKAALGTDGAVRGLVGHLLDQRAEARAAHNNVAATPRQFREDTVALLRRLDKEACTRRLPPYLPRGADVNMLARTVSVRYGVRTNLRRERPNGMTPGRSRPPNTPVYSGHGRRWPETGG